MAGIRTTLLDVVEAVAEVATTDAEILATVRSWMESGAFRSVRVPERRLSGSPSRGAARGVAVRPA